jgi:hypothetical protein
MADTSESEANQITELEKGNAELRARLAELKAQLRPAEIPAPTNFLTRLLEGTPVIRTVEEAQEYERSCALTKAARKKHLADYVMELEKQNHALLEFIARDQGHVKGKPN